MVRNAPVEAAALAVIGTVSRPETPAKTVSAGVVESAAVPLVFQTAWHMLVTRAQMRAGEDVLVLAAGSGVGSGAVQIAKQPGKWESYDVTLWGAR